jgi:dethiobiotin synthetase
MVCFKYIEFYARGTRKGKVYLCPNKEACLHKKSKILLILGTDTDVGKTHGVAWLARTLHQRFLTAEIGVWKPVQSGVCALGETDSAKVQRLAGIEARAGLTLRAPVAPHLAAERQNLRIEDQELEQQACQFASQHPICIVEGAGGVLSPLTRTLSQGAFFARWAAWADLGVVLVARPGVGTVNHSLLSLGALQQLDLPILGFVFAPSQGMDPEVVQDNIAMIEQFSGQHYLGEIPHLETQECAQNCPELLQAVEAFFALG